MPSDEHATLHGEDPSGPTDAPTHPLSRTALLATGGLLGEFYDWLVFGFLAATFATVFFSTGSTLLSLLAFWSTFAVSMLVRPLGGAFFGWLGTRHGRRIALLASVGLMSIPMFATAALPSYAAIGLAAPLLLVALRLIQGFSAGGEFSGSSVYLVEQARSDRRGTVASAGSLAAGAGSVLASGVLTLLALALSEQQMTDWGWRIAYLIGGVVVLAVLLARRRLPETRAFEAARDRGALPREPLRAAIREEWRTMLLVGILTGYGAVAFYFAIVFLPSYLHQVDAGFSRATVLVLLVALSATFAVLAPLFAALADRFGRRPVMAVAVVALGALVYPGLQLLGDGDVLGLWVGAFALVLPTTLFFGGYSAVGVELFSARNRQAAFSITYNVGMAALGGTVGLIATALVAGIGASLGPTVYVAALSILTLAVLAMIPETARTPLGTAARARAESVGGAINERKALTLDTIAEPDTPTEPDGQAR